jgi:integrase/recombinase XerD
MLTIYRRHNPERCKLTSRSDYRCKCPIWVDGRVDGKRIRHALKMRDWAKAQAKIRKWEVDGERPTAPVRATITQLKERFLEDAAARHLASETVRKYKQIFKQLEAFAKLKELVFVSELDIAALSSFRASWKDAALSSAKKTERLRTIFRFAMEQRITTDNPAKKLHMPKIKIKPTLPFTDDEMDKIIKAAEGNARLLAFVYTMRYAGLRIGDTTTLAVSALQGDKLHLYTAKTGTPVRVPLPKYVVKALKDVKRKHPDYFFWTGHHNVREAANTWRRSLAALFKNARIIGGHSHRFRDTFAVGLLQAGVSLENVKTLLGHTNIQITEQHYAPWVRTRQEALEREIYRANELGTELD